MVLPTRVPRKRNQWQTKEHGGRSAITGPPDTTRMRLALRRPAPQDAGMASPEDIIRTLNLQPHPEGGYFRETHRSALVVPHPGVPAGRPAARSAGTSIYFLLAAPDFSAFHRVATDETWHAYDGDPLELHLIHPDGRHEQRLLTRDLTRGEPQTTVPAGCWQAARVAPGGGWTLGGCTVAPGFDFADFEMPPAAAIIREHPRRERLIRELTKR